MDEPAPKAKIFISYSRVDIAVADRLEMALQAHGFEPLIDRRDIAHFEAWWKRIEELIVRCDTVVFVISPDAVKSTSVCQREVSFAQSLNKRLAPILWRATEAALVPEELRRLNWIDFQQDARFEKCMDDLAAALETDIEWVRRHTQFGEFAQRWHAAGRPGPGGLMLRPPLLTEAENWLGSRPLSTPDPTDLVRTFIAASRQAYDQEQAAIAQSQANLLALAGDAEGERGHSDTALKLCVHATREALRRGADPSRATAALAGAVCRWDWRLVLAGHETVCSPPPSAPTGRASSRRHRTRPRASGTPRRQADHGPARARER